MRRRLSQRAAFLQNGKAATLIKVRIVNGLGVSRAEGIRLYQVGQYLGAERDGGCPDQDCLAARSHPCRLRACPRFQGRGGLVRDARRKT